MATNRPDAAKCPECAALVGHHKPCSKASAELQARWQADGPAAARNPVKVGERVVCPDGATGYIALAHPTIPGAVFVQVDEMRAYKREELELDAS